MNTAALLMGLVPLLAFVIVDSFAGIKTALITTVILAFLEAILSQIYFGELDAVSWFSLATVILLAIASYRLKNPLYLKFQPVVLSTIIGLVLLVSYALGHPLLHEMAIKYKSFYGPEVSTQFERPIFIALLVHCTWTTGIALLFHAATTAWAALRMSNWWWIAIRGIGFYGFCFLAFLAAHLIVAYNH